jgi:SAM-dependent methyltransferase
VTPAYIHRSTCRLCNGIDLTKVLTLTPTPPANAFVKKKEVGKSQKKFPLELYFCRSCSHLQLLGVLNPSLLFHNYVYVSSTSINFVQHFKDYANTCVKKFNLTSGDLIVDLGSNDGVLLDFFKKNKMNVLGIDPAKSIASKATARGIETWPEFFDLSVATQIKNKKGFASLVTANNVFAHADNLSGIVKGIRSILTGDGVFVFEVSYLGDVYEKGLFDTIYHEHLAYHSIQPLVAFFENLSMDLFSVSRIPSHGGSIRGMVQLAGGPHNTDGSVCSLINYEKKIKLDKLTTWTRFESKVNLLKEELNKLLKNLKQSGKSIAGFGAPAKATTLMYHFNLGSDIIDFIVDDAPLKQGLFSPGLHVPVLPSEALYKEKPDYVILLAWNFTEHIIYNHKSYLDSGGHFIQPLPNIRIY